MTRFKSTKARKRQQQRLSRLKRQAKDFGITLPEKISTKNLSTNQIKGIATALQKDVARFKRDTLQDEDVLFILDQILVLFSVLKDINAFAYNELSEKIQRLSKVQIITRYKELLAFGDFLQLYEIAFDFFIPLDTRGEQKVQRFYDAEFNKMIR